MNKKKLLKQIVSLVSCISLFLTNPLPSNIIKKRSQRLYYYEQIDELTLPYIRNLIYSSNKLTKREKDYLYNETFLSDLLSTINNDNYLKNKLNNHYTNMEIKSFEIEEIEGQNTVHGHYYLDYPNKLFISNYKGLDNGNKDCVAHEDIHLNQEIGEYNLITEACAEIISDEYFSKTKINAYEDQVILLKILMEIIGSKPIWDYTFTGDFSKIEYFVRPYLTDELYSEFLNDLTFDIEVPENNEAKIQSLYNILSILYKAIYNDDIENDCIIKLIRIHSLYLKRYYFNSNYINQDNSYYVDQCNFTYNRISMQKAIDALLINIAANTKIPLSHELAYKLKEIEGLNIREEIEVLKNETGLIPIKKYYLARVKYLSEEEYRNYSYNEYTTISITHNPNITINNDYTVSGLMPKIIYLTPTSERGLANMTLKK